MIACNLEAIGEAELPKYKSLCARLHAAVSETRELADGYAFRVNNHLLSLVDAAQWISLERLCCPFLRFELRATGDESDYWLSLQGAGEAKAIVREALGFGG